MVSSTSGNARQMARMLLRSAASRREVGTLAEATLALQTPEDDAQALDERGVALQRRRVSLARVSAKPRWVMTIPEPRWDRTSAIVQSLQ